MPVRLTSWLLGALLLVGLSSLALSQGNKLASDKAIIIVKLPADAKLTIDGEATKATGDRRRFSASGLEAGKRYVYTLVATWKQDGKDQSQTKQARFTGGETVEVVFEAKKVDPPKDKDKEAIAKKLEADYKAALAKAAAALKDKKYDDAIKAYDAALKAKPDDKAATDGKAAATKARADEMKKKADDDKKKADETKYQNAMKAAATAVKEKKYDLAIKAYDAALKLKPKDKDASDGKAAAVKAQEDAKMEAAYSVAMKDAKTAVDAKKYAEASKAYDAALKAKPGDKAATDGKATAAKALADEIKKKLDDEKKKAEEAKYQGEMKAALAAAKEKKYADALKAFDAALKLKPNDKAATDGKALVVKAQADAKKADEEAKKKAEEEAKKKAEEAKKMEAAYATAMKDANAALDAKTYAEAIKAFDAALKAKPGDKAATDGKAAAVKAQDEAKKKAEEEAKKKAEEAKKMEAAYATAMKDAKAALDAKKYAEAIKAFDAALKAKPGDKTALEGKVAAGKAQNDEAKKKADEEKKKADEAKKKKDDEAKKKAEDDKKAADAKAKEAAYTSSMTAANAALKAGKYADAIKAFDAALKAMPGDTAAKAGKKAAETEAKKVNEKKAEETLPPPKTEKTGASKEGKSRTFAFTYEATVTGLEKGKKAKVWVPVAQSNDDQDVKLQSHAVTGGVAKAEGKFGNEKQYGNRMFFVETTPDDAGKIQVTFAYQVTRREVKGETGAKLADSADKIERFLQPDTLVPIDGKPLDLIKGKELPDDPMKKARVLYDLVNDHMKYSKDGKGWGRGDSVWACDSKFGNCSDFHSLFISLSRSQKIPAKFEMGFPLPPSRGEGAVGGYHCWAFFKPEGKHWVPVDISEANKDPKLKEYYFGNLTEDRLTFTTGRDIDLEPKQAGKPVNFLIYPHVEVEGKIHDQGKIEKKFGYRDAK